MMSRYSETLLEHFQSPHNRGALKDPHAVGASSLNGQPPYVTIYLSIREDSVAQAHFEAEGCGITIASASALTDLAVGRSLSQCAQLTETDLIHALDGLPEDRRYCATVALRALKMAVVSYVTRQDFHSAQLGLEKRSDE